MQQKHLDKQTRYKKTKHVLGEGSYKTVTKAVDEEEGKEVAYNEVRIKNYEDETKTESSFSKEIALLRNIDHNNIIKILDYWFSEDDFIFITELMTGGSLNEYIEKNGPLGIKLIRKWGKQVLEGLVYLHTQDPPIIHRDIKNDNIFVNTAVGEVKIGDLGLARERRNKRYTIVGTPHFMAREMFEGEGYTEKVDIYAFGMCLIEMATGKRPYTEFTDTKDIYKSVLQGAFPKALQLINEPCLKSLIISCLVPTGFRYNSSQCLEHHFFHPDVLCNGDCVPSECVTVYPLFFEPIKNMELSIVSILDSTVTFQILLFETMKFIKFEYDLRIDTVERVSNELTNERIIDKEAIEDFSNLLSMGLSTVESKLKIGKAHDGIIELNSLETANIKNRDIIISNRARKMVVCDVESSGSEMATTIGNDTLEEMALVEERMKIHEAKLELQRKEEEQVISKPIAAGGISSSIPGSNTMGGMPSSTMGGMLSGTMGGMPSNTMGGMPSSTMGVYTSASHKTNNTSVSHMPNPTSTTTNSSLERVGENSSLDQNDISYSSDEMKVSSKSTYLSDERITREVNVLNKGTYLSNESYTCEMEISKSLKFKNVTKEEPETQEENVYLQFPNVKNSEPTSPMEYLLFSTSSIPQQLEETLNKIESLNLTNAVKSTDCPLITPPVSSPPFSSDKFTEELAVNDLCLNENYERSKIKYKNNHPISLFVFDCAAITGRTEDTSKSWVKALKEEHIEMVFDLKLMVYEDWEKLPLTVFSSRAMQNMIYGIDGVPLKEKQLPLNPKIKEYDNKMTIREFLLDVCEQINRSNLVSNWEDRLLAEDIQTVGELKSLHQDDWKRVGLSVYGNRILKNIILRKGKILID